MKPSRWKSLARAAGVCTFLATASRLAAQCPPDTLLQTIPDPTTRTNDFFGYSVAFSGNLVVVGTHRDDPSGILAAGSAYVFAATTGALTTTLNNPTPTTNDQFGFSVAIDGNVVVVGAPYDAPGGVAGAGTAYVFNATTGDLTATLDNPAPASSDHFGYSVAVSGNIAIVGANGDSPGGVNGAGTAYVFNATTGALLTTLNNPAPAIGDHLGVSVGVFGNIAVVGANQDNPGGVGNAGAAYVFNATTGALAATLNNPAPSAGDEFGFSVAVSGNMAVVGAVADDPGGLNSAGTAYVFNTTTGALTATLNNPAPADFDRFGNSVAISGNLVVVGAQLDDPGGVEGAGKAYVFNATTGALVANLSNPNPATNDAFGVSVAVSGNVAVVGAHLDEPGGVPAAGAAYVFYAPTGTLTATVNNPLPTMLGSFGSSVAVSGDVTVVGAYLDDPGGVNAAGAAYAFNARTGVLTATLNNPAPTEGDVFGYSVAVSGNVAVVGALQDTPGGVSRAGTAYTFDAMTGDLLATLNNPAPTVDDFFANSVAVDGNVAVIGAWHADPDGVQDAGTAYVFDATTGALTATLNNPAATEYDYFGVSVAVSGNVAVVGAYNDYPPGTGRAGSAYIFDAMTGLLTATLSNPSAGSDWFGFSVAVSGNVAVVGAEGDQHAGLNSVGTAYTFNALTGTLIATLNKPTSAVADQFGYSVALSGNVAVVGSRNDDAGGVQNVGSAYVYNATTGALTATLTNPEPAIDDKFGWSVAVSGSVAVVGPEVDDPGGVTGMGSVYTFTCASLVPSPTPTPAPQPEGREVGDFDNSGCTDIPDFLFLLDNWQIEVDDAIVGVDDFLALLDNWLSGPACP